MNILLLLGCALLIAAAALTGAALFAFLRVFGRDDRQEDTLFRNPDNRSADAPWAQRLRAGRTWYHAMEKETWQIQGFDGTSLTASFLAASTGRRATVILCHGWRSTGVNDFACIMEEYHRKGFDLLLVDQRGHRRSGGQWMGFGVLEARDLLCWVREVNRRRGADVPILLHGMSMGGATVQFALDQPLPDNVAGAICDCGFSSPWEVCAAVLKRKGLPQWPLLHLLDIWVRLFAGYHLNACSASEIMKRNRRPVLWLHGEADTMVPCAMSVRTYASARCPKWLVTVPDAEHLLAWPMGEAACRPAMEAFLQHCLTEAVPAPRSL